MKKFRFPLRPVAVLREHHQAQTRDAFARSVQVLVQADEKLAKKRTAREEFEKMMQDGRRATFRPADQISFWDAYRLICDDEKKSEQVVLDSRKAMEACRQKYLEAHRAVKVIEKLEQKARSVYRLEADREAQLESDEQAGMRVSRRLAASTVSSS